MGLLCTLYSFGQGLGGTNPKFQGTVTLLLELGRVWGLGH